MLYSDPVTQGDDDSTVWRKLCFAIQNGDEAPVNLTPPQLSDATPDEGTSVSVSDGTWSGSPTSFTYQWFLDGVLQAETSNTFSIPSEAGGQEVYAVVTATNTTGSTPASSNIGTVQEVDPLAGIPNLFRWYGTKDLATCGMYLDTACTMPITAEFDLVAGFKDEVANVIVGTQPVEDRRPQSRVAADGTWYFEGDGLDDWVNPSITEGGNLTYTVVMRSIQDTWNSYWSPLDSSEAADSAKLWGIVEPASSFLASWQVDVLPDSILRNNVNLPSPYSCDPAEEWQCLTVSTRSIATSAARGIGQTYQTFFAEWACAFFFVNDPGNSPAQIATVNAYANTLIPS